MINHTVINFCFIRKSKLKGKVFDIISHLACIEIHVAHLPYLEGKWLGKVHSYITIVFSHH